MLCQLYCRIISDIVIDVGDKNKKKINQRVEILRYHICTVPGFKAIERLTIILILSSNTTIDLIIISSNSFKRQGPLYNFLRSSENRGDFFLLCHFRKINKRLTDRVSISLFMVLLEYRTRRVGSVSDWDVYFINHTPGAIKHQAVVRRQLPCKTLKYSKMILRILSCGKTSY
ncbi:unnamed protein product [Rhizophagus irregularis]|nr:unnamed protein product [Rhizophagus irregularis]